MAIVGNSRLRLNGAHPKLQALVEAADAVYPISVLCSIRTEAEQNAAFASKKSKLKFPNSKHNLKPGEIFSKAVDIIPYFANAENKTHYDWNDLIAFGRMAGVMFTMAKQQNVRIRWGGDWDGDGRTADEVFKDLPHFELMD